MNQGAFIDSALIHVQAGAGGDGCVAFRREKFVPRGGPSGGDGGRGGNVWLVASREYNTLLHFRKYPHQRAQRGRHGMGDKRSGRKGEDLLLYVPLGTQIFRAADDTLLADLVEDGQRFLASKGGRGGWGNQHFANAVRQAPRFARDGQPGEETDLRLELKLVAQVGLVGLPNAGKSTLLSAISSARPKIAGYPFTTMTPQLGVVEYDDHFTLAVAEIPGIIEGAHEGRGLGLDFLRHAERVRLLCHLVDLSDTAAPDDDLVVLERELMSHGETLHAIPRCIVGTKTDAATAKDHEETTRAMAAERGYEFCSLSAVTGSGVPGFLHMIRRKVA